MLILRFKRATLKRFTYLLLFLFLLIGLTLPFVVMAGDKDGLEKSKKDDMKVKDKDFNQTIGGVKEGKSIWHLKEGFLLQNITPETSVNGELVTVEYENDSKIGSLNVSFKFPTGQAKIEFFEVLRNVTVIPTANITNVSLPSSEIKWVRTAPIILINGSITSYMTNFTFGEKVRASPIPSVLGIFIKYDVSTCNGNDCNIIDPILYGSNIALTATNCYANATYNNVDNGTGNYGCLKLFDNAISPLTSCWVAGDNPSGTPNIQAFNSIQLNRSYNIGTINITQGTATSYKAGNISIEFSNDSTNGKDDGNWTHKAWANMTSGDTDSVNVTNLNGFGNATWIRFNVSNSSSTDANKAIGLCEVLIYEFQAPLPASTLISLSANSSVANSTSSNASVSLSSEQLFGYANYSGNGSEANSTFKWYTNSTFLNGTRNSSLVAMIYKSASLYLHFDEDNWLTDNSGSGRNGDMTGSSNASNTTGIIGKALLFDGVDDFVQVNKLATSKAISNDTNWSVAAWIKPRGSTEGVVLGLSDINNGNRYWWLFMFSTRQLAFQSDEPGGPASCNKAGSKVLANNMWHHVAVTQYLNGSTYLYVNGEVDTSVDCTDAQKPNATNLNIARVGSGDNNRFFNGTIDEVAVYNHTLATSEVKQLYLRTWYDYSPQLFLLQPYRDNSTGLNSSDNEKPTAAENVANASGPWTGTQGANFTTGSRLNYSATNNFNNESGTIEFWVKPDWDGTSANRFILTAVGSNPSSPAVNYFGVEHGQSGDDLLFHTYDDTTEDFLEYNAASWTAGQWKHLAITWELGKNKTLHVDGVEVNKSKMQATIPRVDAISVGMRQTTAAGTECNCTISEFRISRKALSAQEINLSFSKGRQYFQNEYLLNGSNYKKGDALVREYRPQDVNGTYGGFFNSSVLQIVDSPPSLIVTTLQNLTPHSENISAQFNDPDGAADIVNYSISTTSGNCNQLANVSSGNLKNFSFNCTGAGLTAHTVTVTVNDTVGNVSKAIFQNAYPDAPTFFNISFPFDNANTSLNWVNVTNVSDADGDVITVDVFVNGTFNQTGTNITLALTPERNYVINVSISAGGNITLNQTISYQFDNQSPRLGNGSNLLNLSPVYQRTTTASLNFTWAELFNSSVFIRNGTGGTVSNTTPTLNSSYVQHTFTGLNDANYTFSAWMNDTAGNVNETLNVTIVVDTTAPTITYGLGSDGNATSFSRNYILLNITVSETYTNASATMNVSLMNGSSNLVTSINVTYNTTSDLGIASNNVSFLNLANGTYNITITLSDRVGNVNNTIFNRTIRIDTGLPRINWIVPIGASKVSYRNARTIPINSSCEDDLGIFRCNLSIYFGNNGTLLYNNLSDNVNTTVDWRNLTVSVPVDETYIIEMNATDDLTFSPPIPNLQSVSQGLTMTYTDTDKGLNYTITPTIFVSNTQITLSDISFGRTTSGRANQFKTDYSLNLSRLSAPLRAIIANARLILTVESTASLVARNTTNGLILIGGQYYFHVKDIADLGFNVSTNVTNSTRADIIIMQGTSDWLSTSNLG